eukprot:GAHX01002882.1.p1 GENE.GAHX01002882.1~~GAHX01002882.1.p1  ORF type:complete len:338 (-),score=61.83 GAHX01002882.1:122-1135(-)
MTEALNEEIKSFERAIENSEKFISDNIDLVIKHYLATFYDDYMLVIYEHIKGSDTGDKFDEKTLRKELDIPAALFNTYKLALSNNSIIFQTNKVLKVSEYRNSYIWCLNAEKTALFLFYRFYRICEKYTSTESKASGMEYFCTTPQCMEFNSAKRLVDILCDVDTGNGAFKCKLCSCILKQGSEKYSCGTNCEETEKQSNLNTFKEDTKTIYDLLHKLIIKFQDLYELKNKLNKAKYEFEIKKIENYGKHMHNDDFYTISNDPSNLRPHNKDLTSIFRETKKAKIETLKRNDNRRFYIEEIGKEIEIDLIKNAEIDKMNDKEYEEYCTLLKHHNEKE